MFKKIITAFSGIIPTALWEKMEYVSAYFAGKGSGSSSLEAEIRAAARFTDGSDLILLDVGANKGDWTAMVLDAFGSRVKKIYQFEPSAHNVALLKERFRSDARVSLVSSAVSDKKGA